MAAEYEAEQYEPPTLTVLGSVHELTLGGVGSGVDTGQQAGAGSKTGGGKV